MTKQGSTSIHNILSQHKQACTQAQIKRLFQRAALPIFDLTQFHQSKLMTLSQHFVFFVQQLECWNRKIKQQKNSPFSHSQFNRNSFIFSSLKSASTKSASQVQQMLGYLSKWFIKNSYNVPQPSILTKKYNPNQQWQVRKTFRSNTPLQINNYKRRFLCAGDYKENNIFLCANPTDNTQQNAKNINNNSNNTLSFFDENKIRQEKEKRLVRKQYKNMLKSRQDQQLCKANQDYKVKKNRFFQLTSKRFYQGKFHNHSKHFYDPNKRSRNIKTVESKRKHFQTESVIMEIKKKRLNTSLGIRNSEQAQQHLRINSQTQKTDINQQDRYSFINNLMQQYKNKSQNKFLQVSGLHLMSNPFHKKDKLKKQRRRK